MTVRAKLGLCAVFAVILGGCGDKGSYGRELARVGGMPRDLQAYGGSVYILSNDEHEDLTAPEKLKDGPHTEIHSVPEAGGELKLIARLPSGTMRVGAQGIAFAARGQLAVLEASAGGASRSLGAIGSDTSSPVWFDNGVAVLTQDNGSCCSLVRVSLADGAKTPIGSLSGVGEAYVVSDSQRESYVASTATGETVAIDAAGKVAPVIGPTLGVVSCLGLTNTHVWWGHWPDEKADRYVISAMPRAGGPVVDVTEFHAKAGSSCSGNATELFFTRGNDVWTITPGGTPRKVFTTKNRVADLVTGNHALFWAEDTGTQWSIRTAAVP